LLAQQIVTREAAARQLGVVPKFDLSAKSYLRDRQWPGNYNELHQVVLSALGQLRNQTITRESLEKTSGLGGTPTVDLRRHLARLRDEYAQAANILCSGDLVAVGQVLGFDEEKVQRLLNAKTSVASG